MTPYCGQCRVYVQDKDTHLAHIHNTICDMPPQSPDLVVMIDHLLAWYAGRLRIDGEVWITDPQ